MFKQARFTILLGSLPTFDDDDRGFIFDQVKLGGRFFSDVNACRRWVTSTPSPPPHNLPTYHSPLPSTMQYKLALLSAGFGDRFVELSDGVDSGFSQYSTFFSTTFTMHCIISPFCNPHKHWDFKNNSKKFCRCQHCSYLYTNKQRQTPIVINK